MESTPPTASVVAVLDDLFFEAKVRAAARAEGLGTTVARTPSGVRTALDRGGVALVVVDMNSAAGEAAESIRTAKLHASAPRVLAFYSHVDEELARTARAAGAHDVLPRSQFSRDLQSILATAAARVAQDSTRREG